MRQVRIVSKSCKSGVCFSCLADCTGGEVDLVFADSIRREGAGSRINTCISYAVSENVEISL